MDNVMKIDLSAAVTGAVCGAIAALAIALVLGTAGAVRPANDNRAIHDYLLGNPQMLVALGEKLHQQQEQAEDAARQPAVQKLATRPFFDPRVAFLAGPKQ